MRPTRICSLLLGMMDQITVFRVLLLFSKRIKGHSIKSADWADGPEEIPEGDESRQVANNGMYDL